MLNGQQERDDSVWIDGNKLIEVIVRRREMNGIIFILKNIKNRKQWAVFATDDMKPWLASMF